MSALADQPPPTLVEMLARQAARLGDRAAYTFLGEARTFGALWSDVAAFAAGLVERGVGPGDRVVMALPNGHGFFTAFYGAQRARAVAVPIFAGSAPARAVQMAELCGAAAIVVDPEMPAAALLSGPADGSAGAGGRLVVDPGRRGAAAQLPLPEPGDVAFIQYTSGSTGDPKGVQLSHENLLTNIGQMIAGMEITAEDRFVSWLPASHDMGLILMTMVPFSLAAPLVLLPTQMADPGPWLDAITRHRSTFTASPDFGYRLCLRAVERSGHADHDLSSLRVALNAAEPVRASTIDAFHRTFGLTNVMVAAYGLAEATVGVSMWKPSTADRVDERGAVSVGRPFPGIEVRIVDDHDHALPAGEEGHILVKTPAATRGYFDNPASTAALLVQPDTIRTGDIGRLDADGYLYILSRAKDVIIQAGETIYPQEVEEAVNEVPGVRYSAAVGIDHGRVEGEQVTVLAEIRPDELADDAARKRCVVGITNAVAARLGFRPARVHLVRPRTIPMTYNGKLQRNELRRRYVEGALEESFVYPARPVARRDRG